MKKINRNTKIYISSTELFFISIFFILFDYIILKYRTFNLPFITEIDTYPLYGMNYIALYFIFALYKSNKVHILIKKYLNIHDDHFEFVRKEEYFNQLHSSINESEIEYIKKYFIYYEFLTNHKIQIALHCFTVALIIFCIAFLGSVPTFFIFIAGCLFFIGVFNLIQGAYDVL